MQLIGINLWYTIMETAFKMKFTIFDPVKPYNSELWPKTSFTHSLIHSFSIYVKYCSLHRVCDAVLVYTFMQLRKNIQKSFFKKRKKKEETIYSHFGRHIQMSNTRLITWLILGQKAIIHDFQGTNVDRA